MSTQTKIQKFFDDKSVFITGGTGFIGCLLIEKLLRVCPDIKKIYVLIRDKWNVSMEKRLDELLKYPIYDKLKYNNPEQLNKIIPLKGNLEIERLGLSKKDWNTIVDEVTCVFHVGASVKFVSPLENALKSNVFGTGEVMSLAKEIKNLECFIHVSSSYSQCNKDIAEEVWHKSPIPSEHMLLLLKTLGAKLNEVESCFLDNFPNTYTYSKFLAEDLVGRSASDLPIGIVRPSIVCQTWKEPIPGWSDSMNSYTKLTVGFALGLLHILPGNPSVVLDLIPADVVINNIIAAAWDVGTSMSEENVRVYNCASSDQNPLTLKTYTRKMVKYDYEFPSNQKLWYGFPIMSTNKLLERFFYYFHMPQVCFLQAICFFTSKPQNYVELYRKMHSRVQVMTYFLKKSWLFKTENTQKLWDKLDEDDKALFNFDISTLKWDAILRACAKGMRKYMLNEDSTSLSRARYKNKILKIVHYFTIFSMFLFVLKFLRKFRH